MSIINKDETERLADAVLIAAMKFVQNTSDLYDDAAIKRLFCKRATRLHTQRLMRTVDPNLHSRIVISMTGNP